MVSSAVVLLGRSGRVPVGTLQRLVTSLHGPGHLIQARPHTIEQAAKLRLTAQRIRHLPIAAIQCGDGVVRGVYNLCSN